MGWFRQTLAGAALAAVLAGSVSAAGDATELACTCPRLSPDAWQELEARVYLLFAERQRRPRGVELHCNTQRAWVTWEGERLRVAERTPLSDAFLDAIDARLALGQSDPAPSPVEAPTEVAAGVEVESPAASPQPAEAQSTPTVLAPSPAEVPQFDRPRRLSAARAESWNTRFRSSGGLAVGMSAAPPTSSMGTSWGPRLEFGIPVKLLSVIAAESLLFSDARSHSIMVLDLEVGAAFGAPYDRGTVFGANVRLGSEWLVGYSESSEGARTAWAPTLTLGLRTAAQLPVALWAGLDARIRLSSLELGDPINVATPQVMGLGTVGVAFLADGDAHKKD